MANVTNIIAVYQNIKNTNATKQLNYPVLNVRWNLKDLGIWEDIYFTYIITQNKARACVLNVDVAVSSRCYFSTSTLYDRLFRFIFNTVFEYLFLNDNYFQIVIYFTFIVCLFFFVTLPIYLGCDWSQNKTWHNFVYFSLSCITTSVHHQLFSSSKFFVVYDFNCEN